METIGEYMCKSPHQLHHQESIIVAHEDISLYQFQEEDRYWKSYEEEESSSSMDEEDDDLERLWKEIEAKGHGMMKNLISKVENNIPFELEEEFRDAWHHLGASRMVEKIARKVGRGREGEFAKGGRGIDLEEELKNERFKMKTVNVAGSGVVKEEGRQ